MSAPARDDTSEGTALRRVAARLWHAQRVRRLVRSRLPAEAVVMVAETVCRDTLCPGPATQITILGFDMSRRVLLIHRPMAEVTAADLAASLR